MVAEDNLVAKSMSQRVGCAASKREQRAVSSVHSRRVTQREL